MALAITALVIGLGWAGPGIARAETLSDVRARGVLRWGADLQGGEPFAFQDARQGGALVGFEVEIAAGLGRHLGVRAEMVAPEGGYDAPRTHGRRGMP